MATSSTFSAKTALGSGTYSGDYAWSNALNWSAGLPDQNTSATIGSTTAVTYTLLVDGVDTVNQVTFGSGLGSLNLLIQAGDSLTANNGAFVSAGSTLTIGAGSAGAFVSGGAVEVRANGILNVLGGTFTTKGSLILDTGAFASFGSGVTLNVSTLSLGTTTNLIVNAGSQNAPNSITNVNDSAASSKLTEAGGTLQIGTGGAGTYVVSNGGTIEFTTGLNAGAIVDLNGGLVQIDNNVSLQGGTSFTFGGTAASTLDVVSSNNFTNGFAYGITNFDYGDKLQFGTLSLTGDTYSYSGSTLTITSGSTTMLKLTGLHLAAGVTTPNFILSGNTIQLACFLSGTLIETAQGEVPVETLRAGDLVVTLEHGERVLRPARWIGSRSMEAAQFPDDEDAHPVRIRADAFAPGLPRRDLLVTGEHGIYVDGGLVPARMLVNGRSILRDTTTTRYVVHHVEFDAHCIMLAEGLPTESYLDTGNRGSFGHPGSERARQRAMRSWTLDAAAPLLVCREAVEPIWQALARRADALGLAPVFAPELLDDPDLTLQLADGRIMAPRWSSGEQHLFHLPPGAQPVRLLSRSARPSEVVGAFVDDRRRLGIAVCRITLWNGLSDRVLRAEDLKGAGWHTLEHGHRWTDGQAALSVPAATSTDCFLEVQVAARLRYPARCDQAIDLAA